jgi:hypothetical protein
MRLALLLVLALLLSACGSGSSAHPPGGPAPSAGRSGPPPAWIETEAGSRWLGYSSYCWKHPRGNAVEQVCADYAAAKCNQRSVPNIRVRSGETVRAHLGFAPTEASVEGADATLSGRIVAWRVGRGGPFQLFARARDADAIYVGCGAVP